MKITRGRFQQILKEEVESFLKQEAKKEEEVELSESELEELLFTQEESASLSDEKLNKLLSQEDAVFAQQPPHKLIPPKK